MRGNSRRQYHLVKVFCCTLIHCFSTVNIFAETFRAEWQWGVSGGAAIRVQEEMTAIKAKRLPASVSDLDWRSNTKGGSQVWAGCLPTITLATVRSCMFECSYELDVNFKGQNTSSKWVSESWRSFPEEKISLGSSADAMHPLWIHFFLSIGPPFVGDALYLYSYNV